MPAFSAMPPPPPRLVLPPQQKINKKRKRRIDFDFDLTCYESIPWDQFRFENVEDKKTQEQQEDEEIMVGDLPPLPDKSALRILQDGPCSNFDNDECGDCDWNIMNSSTFSECKTCFFCEKQFCKKCFVDDMDMCERCNDLL